MNVNVFCVCSNIKKWMLAISYINFLLFWTLYFISHVSTVEMADFNFVCQYSMKLNFTLAVPLVDMNRFCCIISVVNPVVNGFYTQSVKAYTQGLLGLYY